MPGMSTTGIPYALPDDIANEYPENVDQPRAELLCTKAYVDSRIWYGTQPEYDAIPTKDPNTLYVIV